MKCPDCQRAMKVWKVRHPTHQVNMRVYGCKACSNGMRLKTQEVAVIWFRAQKRKAKVAV